MQFFFNSHGSRRAFCWVLSFSSSNFKLWLFVAVACMLFLVVFRRTGAAEKLSQLLYLNLCGSLIAIDRLPFFLSCTVMQRSSIFHKHVLCCSRLSCFLELFLN
jgi:hypothetical protein